jgi:hypothetical protein
MTNETARIAHYKARIFILEQNLENTESLELEQLQAITNEINNLEHKIESAHGQLDAGIRRKGGAEQRVT